MFDCSCSDWMTGWSQRASIFLQTPLPPLRYVQECPPITILKWLVFLTGFLTGLIIHQHHWPILRHDQKLNKISSYCGRWINYPWHRSHSRFSGWHSISLITANSSTQLNPLIFAIDLGSPIKGTARWSIAYCIDGDYCQPNIRSLHTPPPRNLRKSGQ